MARARATRSAACGASATVAAPRATSHTWSRVRWSPIGTGTGPLLHARIDVGDLDLLAPLGGRRGQGGVLVDDRQEDFLEFEERGHLTGQRLRHLQDGAARQL